jgi:WD40 repeat protein
VSFAVFSQDGQRLTTRSNDGTVRVWDVPAPVKATVEQIRLWVQVSSEMELDGDVPRLLDEKELAERAKRLVELEGHHPW